MENDEFKILYQKIMIGAITIIIAGFGWFATNLVKQVEQMNNKLDTIIVQVVVNQKDIEHLKGAK